MMHPHYHSRPRNAQRLRATVEIVQARAPLLHSRRARQGLLGLLCCTVLANGAVFTTRTFSAQAPVVVEQAAQAVAVPVVAAVAIPELPRPPAAPVFPASVNLRISSGDTLLTLLTDTGVSYEEAHQAVQAIRTIYDPRALNVGQQVAVDLGADQHNPSEPVLSSLSLPVSKTAKVELKRTQSGDFRVKRIDAPVVKKLVRTGGQIRSSFYQTGMAAGLSPETLGALIKVYSYDVDFQRDIKRGDKLDLLVERTQLEDGTVVSTGDVVYVNLDLGSRKLPVYRYKDKNGNVDYYNDKGESLRKALLRTPINGAKITSGFGMRMHPLLGYSKMHRGVDFGALAGTPIYAAGDGVVEMAGMNGTYGNYVRIKHDAKYATAYAHASRIAAGVKAGVKVKQGQVIAYVGSTGRSTGAHLHYEILAGAEQINPAGVKFKTGNSLSGKEMAAFKSQVSTVQAQLKGKDGKQVASR